MLMACLVKLVRWWQLWILSRASRRRNFTLQAGRMGTSAGLLLVEQYSVGVASLSDRIDCITQQTYH